MSKTTKYEEARIEFIGWHKDNPEVWQMFEEACWKAIGKGHRAVKASTVLGGVAWRIFIQREEEVRFPQHVGAFYSRMWIKKNPEMPLFKVKEMDGETRWKTEHIQQQNLFAAPNPIT